jgi:hypothetical protein
MHAPICSESIEGIARAARDTCAALSVRGFA